MESTLFTALTVSEEASLSGGFFNTKNITNNITKNTTVTKTATSTVSGDNSFQVGNNGGIAYA